MQSANPTPPLTTSNSSSTSTPAPPTPIPGKGKCTKDHVRYCMDVLAAHFEGREPMAPTFTGVNDKYAIFVTWNTIDPSRPHSEPRLRGCIGTFSPMPLAEGLKEHALISALKDHRFNPISESELPRLQCGISILTPTTPISDPLAWTPGIHGIQISFPVPSPSSSSSSSFSKNGRRLSATYLPEIATDQGWSREETILSAIAKAGYRGRVHVGDAIWKSLEVGVYESSKSKLDWAEFEAWRAGR